MSRILLIAASLGLAVSSAGACEFQRSAKADVDPTIVASTAVQSMSTPEMARPVEQPAAKTLLIDDAG